MEIYQGTANAIYKFNQFELNQHDKEVADKAVREFADKVNAVISRQYNSYDISKEVTEISYGINDTYTAQYIDDNGSEKWIEEHDEQIRKPLEDEIERLKKENEELKLKIKSISEKREIENECCSNQVNLWKQEVEALKKENQDLKSASTKLAVEKLEEIKDRLESLDYKTSSKKEQNEKINYSVNALLSDLKGESK